MTHILLTLLDKFYPDKEKLVKELAEKLAQEKTNKLKKNYEFETFKLAKKAVEFKKDLWVIATKNDPFWLDILGDLPDDKKILARVRTLVKKEKKLNRIVNDLQADEDNAPKEVKRLIKVEDENQELKDEKVELIEKHENELCEVKENLKRAAKLTIDTALNIDTKVQSVFKEKEEAKSKILEEEKK